MGYYKKTIPTKIKEAVWCAFVIVGFFLVYEIAIKILDIFLSEMLKVSITTQDYHIWFLIGMSIGILAGAFYQWPRKFGARRLSITVVGLILDVLVIVSVTALAIGYEPIVDFVIKCCGMFGMSPDIDATTRSLIAFSIIYGWPVGRIYTAMAFCLPMPQHWKLIKYHKLAKQGRRF